MKNLEKCDAGVCVATVKYEGAYYLVDTKDGQLAAVMPEKEFTARLEAAKTMGAAAMFDTYADLQRFTSDELRHFERDIDAGVLDYMQDRDVHISAATRPTAAQARMMAASMW